MGEAFMPSATARHECGICWHVYDPAEGDASWQVPPGTPFEALPGHWSCPHCGGEKSRYFRIADE